jgi:hypothetical protein
LRYGHRCQDDQHRAVHQDALSPAGRCQDEFLDDRRRVFPAKDRDGQCLDEKCASDYRQYLADLILAGPFQAGPFQAEQRQDAQY